jgi:hypothetical protein
MSLAASSRGDILDYRREEIKRVQGKAGRCFSFEESSPDPAHQRPGVRVLEK